MRYKNKIWTLMLMVVLFLSTALPASAGPGGHWGYGTSTAFLSSDGNSSASGSASTSAGNEVTQILSSSSSNGSISASFSGSTISASWSGGSSITSEIWRPASSSTYAGSENRSTSWSKTLSESKIRNVSCSISSGSCSVSGHTINYNGSGASNSNQNWNTQSASASASNGGSSQNTSGYGVTAQRYSLSGSGASGDVASSGHNISSVHVWASVSAKAPTKNNKGVITKSTSASSYTNARYQNDYFYYTGSASYEYANTATTYNYTGTVNYKYKYWIPNSPPNVYISNNAPNPLYRGTAVTFYGSATDSDGTVISKSWGGVTSGSGGTATYTPWNLGDFTATYTATDDIGDSTTASSTITVVNRNPNVSATNNANPPVYRYHPITLTGTAGDIDGNIVSTNWTGIVNGSGYTKSYTPTTLGTFEATFTATDNDGGSAQAGTAFTVVNAKPSVEIISPLGTKNKPDVVPGTSTIIKWNYSDPDGEPQTSFRVKIYNEDGTPFKDSGQIMSAEKSYDLSGLVAGNVYYFTVTVTDPWDSAISSISYFRAGENFAVNDLIPRPPLEVVSKNPEVKMFIAGKYGPANFPVDVKVQKTIGQGSNTVKLTLTRTGYGKTWTETRTLKVGTTEQTITYTVPNVTHEDIRAWQAANGKKNTVYDSFKFTAVLDYDVQEITKDDNQKSNQFRTAEYGRAQLTK